MIYIAFTCKYFWGLIFLSGRYFTVCNICLPFSKVFTSYDLAKHERLPTESKLYLYKYIAHNDLKISFV